LNNNNTPLFFDISKSVNNEGLALNQSLMK